tara:strand:- start:9534 stop:10190 length:657 start_codon:yes stop_codon:yes gene_type:complete
MIKTPGSPDDSYAFSSRINYDPATIMVAGTAISAGTSIYSGMAQGAASDANAAVANQNAELADANSKATLELAYQNIAAFEEDYDSFEGDSIVNFAKSGVRLDSPTVIEVLHSNRANAEVEKSNILYNARVESNSQKVQAGQFRTQAAISKMNAKAARITGIANAAGSMVGAYGGYKQVQTQSVFNASMLKSQEAFTNQLIDLNNNHRMSMAMKGYYF